MILGPREVKEPAQGHTAIHNICKHFRAEGILINLILCLTVIFKVKLLLCEEKRLGTLLYES